MVSEAFPFGKLHSPVILELIDLRSQVGVTLRHWSSFLEIARLVLSGASKVSASFAASNDTLG